VCVCVCVCTCTIVLQNNSSGIDAYHQLQGEILSLVLNRESSSCECEESVMCFMCGLLCTMSSEQLLSIRKKLCRCTSIERASCSESNHNTFWLLQATRKNQQFGFQWGQRICSITKEKLDAALSDALQLKLEVLWGLWMNRQW
jgi:hypothetical protein